MALTQHSIMIKWYPTNQYDEVTSNTYTQSSNKNNKTVK